MSLAEIKGELAVMPQEQQDHLAAYLVHLRHRRDTAIRSEITADNDDRNPQHWISPAELREDWKD